MNGNIKYVTFASSHPEANRLKNNVGGSASREEKQKEVLDSIRHAKRIQLAQMPSEKLVNRMRQRPMKSNFS